MPSLRSKRQLYVVLTLVLIAASSFRPVLSEKGKMRLRGISTDTRKTLISYNTDKSIAQLLTICKTTDGGYTTTRIPVYRNGKLMKVFVADDESSHAPSLFSSFEYSEKGHVRRVLYYLDGEVHGYDSLAYNAKGEIIARYFFNEAEDGASFENKTCQLYNWDQKGNIIMIENMGRVNKKLPFTLSSTTEYTYDDHPNAQRNLRSICFLTDIAAANLSANNIVTETIRPATGGNSIVNHYSYAYNAERYPTRITTHYAINNEMTVTELEWD